MSDGSNDNKRHFSNIIVIEVTVKEALRGLADDISRLEGVRRVDMGADGMLHKLTIHTTVGFDIQEQISAVAGRAGIENMVSREPTLEEAYLNILK